jgi:hypothetical protein
MTVIEFPELALTMIEYANGTVDWVAWEPEEE